MEPVARCTVADLAVASVAERIARVMKECSGVWGQSGITSWERDRLNEWQWRSALSEKQEAVLQQIERKAFPEEHEEQ